VSEDEGGGHDTVHVSHKRHVFHAEILRAVMIDTSVRYIVV
jgi:hypothetical protein